MVEFNERLKDLMSYFNISQADISSRTGINKSLISHYLKGDRSPKQDKIFILHQTYGVSIQWLLGYDYPMFENHNDERKSRFVRNDILYNKSLQAVSGQTEDFDFGYTEEETQMDLAEDNIETMYEMQKEISDEKALNKLKMLTQITSALATMSDEDFEMVYKLAIRLSK